MKYIKLFEGYQSDEEIHEICGRYLRDETNTIVNYTINNGVVDVNGSVDLKGYKLNKLPMTFGKVSGDFNCAVNNLISLEGCPTSVGGYFSCSSNRNLESLEGCPTNVGLSFNRDFLCSDCNLTSFEFMPERIGGYFICWKNPIFNIWKLFDDLNQLEYLIDCDPIREPDEDGLPIVILQRLNHFLEEIGREPVTEVEGYKCI